MFKLSLNAKAAKGGTSAAGGSSNGGGAAEPTRSSSADFGAAADNTPTSIPIVPSKSPLRSATSPVPPRSTSRPIPQHPLAAQPQQNSNRAAAATAQAPQQTARSATIDGAAATSNGGFPARSKDEALAHDTTSNSNSSYLGVTTNTRRKRAPSDASTGMQATASWFAGSTTDDDDDDDEDDNDTPVSPNEPGSWPAAASASLLERAKEALVTGSISGLPGVSYEKDDEAHDDLLSPLANSRSMSSAYGKEVEEDKEAPQQSTEKRRFGEASPSQLNSRRSATLPTSESSHRNLATPPRSLSASVPQEQTKLTRSPSRISGGGILGRLKRISKKEKRGSTILTAAGPSDALASMLSPALVSNDGERVLAVSPDRAEKLNVDETETPTAGDATITSSTSSWSRNLHQADLPLQDASRAKTPQFGVERVQSIHSVQPSLVDDESIAGRESPSGSPFDIDDDEIDWVVHSEAGPGVSSSDAAADDDIEWHMQNMAGAFPMDRSASNTSDASATVAIRSAKVTPPTIHLTEGTPDEDSTAASPTIDVEPATKQVNAHASRRSDYTQALSRQSSDYSTVASSSASSEKDYLDPLLTLPKEGGDDEDDEAVTPRAITEAGQTSYFDKAPSASSTAPQQTTPHLPVSQAESWLDKAALAQEERHYLVRHLVTQQMTWEAKRLFLIQRTADLHTPSPPDALPKTDLGYLKPNAGDFTPNLPVTRLVVRHILMTCPIFSAATPIEGAAAERVRAAGATRFMDEGVLPLARFIQQRAISHAVDVNGEWPDEMFDAPSTLDLMSASAFKLLARFVTALADGRGHGFLWTKIPVPDRASFFAHRTTLNKLKQGGMEVNVVGSRLRPNTRECELIVSVHRYGFPPAYVVRTESDFYQYARTLAEELGPQVRVRPVPAPDVDFSALSTPSDDHLDARSASSSPAGMVNSKPSSLIDAALTSPTLPTSLEVPPVGGGSAQRPSPTRLMSSNSLGRVETINMSSLSLVSSASARRPSSMDGGSSIASSSKAAAPTATSPRERASSRSIFAPSVRSPFATHKSNSMVDLSKLHPSSPTAIPITTDEEVRRRQLRTWLRDTLSIRGAGHAKQTMSFLLNDSFVERDLKPASRNDIRSRLDVDEAAMRDRERVIDDAPREVAELRREMEQMWRECVEGDGFERALSAVQRHTTFSSLPLAYQRLISWTNLQVAAFLHHTFLDSHEARANFDRLQEIVSAVPWRLLSVAMRERTGWMMQKVQAAWADEFVQKKLLAVLLQDGPLKKVETELAHLRTRLGSTVMRKLDVYVHSTAWQKSIVRRAAQQADIPLVSAIMRGSDRPLLSSEGIKRITTATRTYQQFVNTQPTYDERKAKLKSSVEVRLIYDLQRALRLMARQRDGKAIREAMAEELKPALAAVTAPLLDLLRRLHRMQLLLGRRNSTASSSSNASSSDTPSPHSSDDVVMELQQFCFRLLDVLAGLRMRVQEPWRSLGTLTLVLDDVIPSWYRRLHASSLADSLVHDLTMWLQSVASLLRFRAAQDDAGSDDLLSRFWPKPTAAGKTASTTTTTTTPLQAGRPDRIALEALVEAAWHKRTRQMQTGCRWAAGEADGELDVQLMGEGGKTRTARYEMPKQKRGPSAKVQAGLGALLPGFRTALNHVLTAETGTAW